MQLSDSLFQSKKKCFNFPETAGMDKHERIAHHALRDILLFHKALEEEMRRLVAKGEKATAFERDIFQVMLSVKEKYLQVMHSLREPNEDRQRHALIVFADAAKDLMGSIHYQRRH